MPHYKDGTEAKLGDLVKGRGYNVDREIVGKVIQIAKAESCNLAIAHIGHGSQVLFSDAKLPQPHAENAEGHTQIGYHVIVTPVVEYGQADAFEKID